jgi:hypothetical protein
MTPEHYGQISSLQDQSKKLIHRRGCGGLVATFPAVVGCVSSNASTPIVNGTFVTMRPVNIAGVESEASPGVLSEDNSYTFLAYVVGSASSAVGDYLVCHFVGNRWVAERMGGGNAAVVIPGCPCSRSPRTLYMTSSNPNSNNHILQNATLVYGPTPSNLLPLAIGQSSYLSTTTFTDFSTGDQFWYYLSCYLGYYVLTRVYATSLYGSPYRDATRYRWPIGFPGNSCTPFLLANGQIFSGGDPSCAVTISGTNPYG